MADRKLEKLMLESLKHLVDQDNLGMTKGGAPAEGEHHTQFQWEEINDAFALKMKASNFFDSVTSAFYKVHTGRWLCDNSFNKTISSELHAMGVPEEEIGKVTKAVDELKKKYVDDGKKNENAVGYPDMEAMKKVSQEFGNKPVSSGETFKGDNKPPLGVEPKNTRPTPSKA